MNPFMQRTWSVCVCLCMCVPCTIAGLFGRVNVWQIAKLKVASEKSLVNG